MTAQSINIRVLAIRALLVAALVAVFFPEISAFASNDRALGQDDCQVFEETGFEVCGELLDFWNNNGGLPVFGYPLTDAFDEPNYDTGETYLTQYFERERLEVHPENDPPFNVLLGRLGAQVLELNGRNWQDFPKMDPSAENYFDVTGFAIAPEFYDYWSSHGLEYGDPGFSFRESLLLFGYPISPPQMETNPDGDTVLTQWFERARFEFHPDNDSEFQVLLGLLGRELTDGRGSERPFQPVEAGSDAYCTFYPPTGHRLCFGFRDYWRDHGGLAIFGYPISEEFRERNRDTGQFYTVQYFERARFEWHPENAGTPYVVLLGRMGAQVLAER